MAAVAVEKTVREEVEKALADGEVNLASETGREQTERIIEHAVSAYQAQALSGQNGGEFTDQDRAELTRALRDDFIGLGTIAEKMLADPDAQEWMVNAPKRVFKDNGERIERVTDVVFRDNRQVRNFIERLLEQVEGKKLDRLTPMVEARLPDGSRISATLPPISSNGNVICTIRRFRLVAMTLQELVTLEFLSDQASDFLSACVKAGKNIIVAGPVSTGKTTLLNALGQAIPGGERVVVCESSAELQLPQVLQNCIGLEARPASADGLAEIALEKLVAEALRANPDRIIVGECRGPEAMALLWALASGHAGMSSVHGESAEHTMSNLVRFALTSGTNIDGEQARDWLRDVHVVIHCDRPRSNQAGERHFLPRRIDEIVEVAGVEGRRMSLNPLFTGSGADLQWAATGPAFLDDLERTGYRSPQ